jgi:hypothetical protein
MNWLAEMSRSPQTAVALEPPSSPSPTGHLDALIDRAAEAEKMGRELAHKDSTLLEEPEKVAMLGGLLTGGIGRAAAGMMMRNPSKALAVGGAAIGGLRGALKDPGVDQMTGQPNSRIGNAVAGAAGGGLLGYGASKIPGVGKATQGGGKMLSKEIRGNNYRNLQGPLGRAPGAKPATPSPVGSGAPAGGGPAAGPASAKTPSTTIPAEPSAGSQAFKSGLSVPAEELGNQVVDMGGGVKAPASALGGKMLQRGRFGGLGRTRVTDAPEMAKMAARFRAKLAELLETNDKPAEPLSLTSPGKQSYVPPIGDVPGKKKLSSGIQGLLSLPKPVVAKPLKLSMPAKVTA